ncbi:hypothetical protein ACFQX6_38245 [Streptosporangium lutulentum]
MSFTSLTLLMTAVLVGYLALVSPLIGKRSYDRLARSRDQDPTLYRRTNVLWGAELWTLAAVALLIVVVEPSLDTADIGLVIKEPLSDTLGTVVGFLCAAAVGTFVISRLAAKGKPVPGQQTISHLLPRTSAERWYAAGLSVTAASPRRSSTEDCSSRSARARSV